MSPEMAVCKPWSQFFSTPFAKKHLILVAVDEAHCITDWLAGNSMCIATVVYLLLFKQGEVI